MSPPFHIYTSASEINPYHAWEKYPFGGEPLLIKESNPPPPPPAT